MQTITYNLNLENYEDYYLKIRKFTSDVINESKLAIGDVICDFQNFLFKNPPKNLYLNKNFKKDHNFKENVFELLFLGIMWKNYIKVAIDLDPLYQDILAKLVDLRNQKDVINLEDNGYPHLKEKIDEIRGCLATKHLLTEDIKTILNNNYKDSLNKDIKNILNSNYKDSLNKDIKNIHNNNQDILTNDNENIININYESPENKYLISNENYINFNIKNLDHLLNYLKATGDYEEALKHLLVWKQFFSNKNDKKIDYYFKKILSFTNWFEKIANKELHNYVFNVDNFRENQIQYHTDNEDIIFCARDRSEYYLNIFGAEAMNCVFRYEFEKRDKIAIILPTCMKFQNNLNEFNKDRNNSYNIDNKLNQECMGIQDHLGLKCISCREKCNIGEINEIIKQEYNNYNITVYISPHNSAILSNITKKDKKELAIVGVACINNLIEGGWKISSSGIPAQCVVLDYVGCRKHWTNKDFPTNFNLNELNRIINIKTILN